MLASASISSLTTIPPCPARTMRQAREKKKCCKLLNFLCKCKDKKSNLPTQRWSELTHARPPLSGDPHARPVGESALHQESQSKHLSQYVPRDDGGSLDDIIQEPQTREIRSDGEFPVTHWGIVLMVPCQDNHCLPSDGVDHIPPMNQVSDATVQLSTSGDLHAGPHTKLSETPEIQSGDNGDSQDNSVNVSQRQDISKNDRHIAHTPQQQKDIADSMDKVADSEHGTAVHAGIIDPDQL
ncbi:hypothetical protein C8R45DRAFT_1077042 [Mycena sanguinolenta]|nr:hypothetical protein C8R45DRAFT_1077042 [Mycena sanguinolenta]